MYKGWTLEDQLQRLNDHAVVTRSHYGYRVLNTSNLGVIDVDHNLEYDTLPQHRERVSDSST